MIHSDLFTKSREVDTDQAFYLQNSKLLKVELSHGPVKALVGSMVAYQGDAKFERKGSGSLMKSLTRVATGQGGNNMSVSGRGEVFFGHGNADVQVLRLENDSIIVNSANLLAFSDTLDDKVERVKTPGAYMAGGLWNTRLSGSGWVAILTAGQPFTLNVQEAPTFADPQAVVLWVPTVDVSIRVQSGGVGSVLRGGTGEAIQMGFSGEGFVVIQSSELVTANEAALTAS